MSHTTQAIEPIKVKELTNRQLKVKLVKILVELDERFSRLELNQDGFFDLNLICSACRANTIDTQGRIAGMLMFNSNSENSLFEHKKVHIDFITLHMFRVRRF